MNALRIAIVTIIFTMFSANVLAWHFKNKSRIEQPNLENRQDGRVNPIPQAQTPAPIYQAPIYQAPIVTGPPRSYKQALEQARQTNRSIFFFFTSSRCGYCTQMKNEVLSQPAMQQYLSQYIVYFVQTDGPEGYIAQEAGISSVPYYVICTPERKVLKFGQGYRSYSSFQEWLR